MDDLTGDDDGELASLPTTRLYGGIIAVVSGGYSAYLSTTGTSLTAWPMLALGVVVAVHGLVLFTDYATRLGDASGPLMVGYAALMLLMQAWLSLQPPGDGMDEGTMGDGAGMMGDGAGTMGDGMAAMADPGMVALAIVMLASGLVMTTRAEGM